MAILFENSAFGTSLSKAVQEWTKEVRIEVADFEPYEAEANDFKPMLLKVKAKNPDVIFMVSYLKDAMLLMRQSKELDINPKIFAGGAAGFTLPEFIDGAKDAAELVYSATPWTPDVKYRGGPEVLRHVLQEVRGASPVSRRRGVRGRLRPQGCSGADEVPEERGPA